MIRRLLLVAAGGGSFTPPTPPPVYSVLALSAAPYGMWPGWTQAFYHGGTSYVGFCDNAGLIYVGSYDHASGVFTKTVVGGPTAIDQHDATGIVRRSSDGRLVALFCSHNSANIYRRISTNPEDATAWGATDNMDSSIGGSAYTYPALYELSDESKLYAFMRCDNNSSLPMSWGISTSADDGATWSAKTVLFAGDFWYAKSCKATGSRLDFLVTTGANYADHSSVYHVYYQGGSWFKSDGTSAGSPPFATTDMTLVYDASATGSRVPGDIASDGTTVVATFPRFVAPQNGTIGSDEDLLYGYWNGSSWSVNTVAANIGATVATYLDGGIAIDSSDFGHVQYAAKVGGVWQMFDATTTDQGATWEATQLTTTAVRRGYPWFVRDHSSGLVSVWLLGTFTDQDTFDTGIEGYGVA